MLVILLQQGKGGDIANAFGGGASQAAFGARSGATVLSRATTVLRGRSSWSARSCWASWASAARARCSAGGARQARRLRGDHDAGAAAKAGHHAGPGCARSATPAPATPAPATPAPTK